MGVYIPNMSKPKFCKCEEYNCFAWDDEKYKCKITEWKKPCPLIEIDLVRCGECKWCDDKGKERALICTNPYIDMDIHPLDFCSYGKRRTDETIESITFKKMVKAVEEEMREVRNFVKRRNDGAVCSYGVSANANQHTQRIEGVGEREPEDFNPYQGDRDRDENGDIY